MQRSSADAKRCRPFLKWAGNKYRILENIQQLLPPGKRLIEPFAGSAAVFLNTDYDRYLVSDSNPDLINLYNTLKQEGSDFIQYCRRFFSEKNNSSEAYYRLREQFNRSTDIHKRSALFLYLNRHGYNGLCRYNASGGFNVPFGRYKKPYFPQKEMLFFHEKSPRAQFKVASFEKTMQQAKSGDVIYCDPPYVPLSSSANFTTYSAGGFSMEQQQQLASMAADIAAKGIPVLISNHCTDETDSMYKTCSRQEKFTVQRYISCNGTRRESAGEILALFE